METMEKYAEPKIDLQDELEKAREECRLCRDEIYRLNEQRTLLGELYAEKVQSERCLNNRSMYLEGENNKLTKALCSIKDILFNSSSSSKIRMSKEVKEELKKWLHDF